MIPVHIKTSTFGSFDGVRAINACALDGGHDWRKGRGILFDYLHVSAQCATCGTYLKAETTMLSEKFLTRLKRHAHVALTFYLYALLTLVCVASAGAGIYLAVTSMQAGSVFGAVWGALVFSAGVAVFLTFTGAAEE